MSSTSLTSIPAAPQAPAAARWWMLAGIALLCAAPWVAYPMFLIKLLCLALLAASVNFLITYAGLLSFGHAMFYGSAAYVTGHVAKFWGLDGTLAILAGVGVAAALGLVTGFLAIRRQGIYFSMITLAFAQVVYFLAMRLPFTHGEDGLQSVPRPRILGWIDTENTMVFYYLCLLAIGMGFWLIYRTVHSPFGQVLRAIRDNEPRAKSLGYPVNRYKLLAFVLSASLAGLAGSMKVLAFSLATLTDVGWGTSGEALLICIVGGLGTMLGPGVGAIVMGSMEHYLASFAEWVLIIQGLVFVLVVMLFRKGLVGQWLHLLPWTAKASTPAKDLA
jgi:branched-chain amino acid transport system permease protein